MKIYKMTINDGKADIYYERNEVGYLTATDGRGEIYEIPIFYNEFDDGVYEAESGRLIIAGGNSTACILVINNAQEVVKLYNAALVDELDNTGLTGCRVFYCQKDSAVCLENRIYKYDGEDWAEVVPDFVRSDKVRASYRNDDYYKLYGEDTYLPTIC